VRCTHRHEPPRNLNIAIKQSCNPYFYQVMRAAVIRGQSPNKFEDARLGLGQWQKMVKSFGLGEKLGVDMAQEKRGLIPSPDYYDQRRGFHHWNFRTVYSLAIGQGEIGITGLQMANIMATIANRGWYYTPHFVRGIGNGGPPASVSAKALHRRRHVAVQVHHPGDARGGGMDAGAPAALLPWPSMASV
jgi:penicillin-binding protein 2